MGTPPRYQAGTSLQLKVEAQRKISPRNGQLRVSSMGSFRVGFWGVPNKRSPVHCRGPVLAKWCNPPRWVGTVLFLAPSHKARPSIRTTGRQPDFPPGKAGSATTVARRSLFRPRIDPPIFLIGWPPHFFNFRSPHETTSVSGGHFITGYLVHRYEE